MNFEVDWIYRLLNELSEEHAAVSGELTIARIQKIFASSILSILAALFIYLAFSSSTSFWQGIFIELASASGFFVAVPLVFALSVGQKKKKIFRLLLFLAVLCLTIGWFLTGFSQSILIESGVSLISIAILDVVIQTWMNNLKSRIRELETQLAELSSRLP